MGQETYKSITKNYLRNSDGVLFVFDLSERESFDNLKSWYDFYKKEKSEESINGVLIRNKSDIEPKVTKDEAENFDKEYNLKYYETSAKLDKKLEKAIIYLLNKIIESKALYDNLDSIECQRDGDPVQLNPEQSKEKSSCTC